MWMFTAGLLPLLLSVLYIFRRILMQETTKEVLPYRRIPTCILLVFYIPIFLVKGLVPAILAARKYYGPTFYLHIWGMKRRIFFITGLSGRSAISKNQHLRLPAAQVADVFGIGKEIAEMFAQHDYIHLFGDVLHGAELKHMTSRHSENLQKTIRDCLHQDQKWIEGGLFDLCQTLVYESITTTLYGASVNSRLIVKEMKILDTDVHLLAYPSPFRWFRPDLILSRNTIAEHLSASDMNDSESAFAMKVNSIIDAFSKEDMGSIKTAILWAAFGNVIPAVFWTYYHLCRYPKVFDVVLCEMKDTSSLVEEDDSVHILPTLDSVIEETMRLMANALVLRECAQDTHVIVPGIDHKISLMKNDIIILFPFASQIDEQFFPRPHEFIYNRFVFGSPNEVSPTARRAHAPFGEGKFICPGRHLGKNIVKLTLVALLRQFNIQFLNQSDKMKMPEMHKARHGFGIPPPVKDVRIRYQVK